jgi:hypothetical protein
MARAQDALERPDLQWRYSRVAEYVDRAQPPRHFAGTRAEREGESRCAERRAGSDEFQTLVHGVCSAAASEAQSLRCRPEPSPSRARSASGIDTILCTEFPKRLPAGTKVTHSTTWDNSTQNEADPDPNREVPWGLQTWDEMLYGVVRLRYVDGAAAPDDSSGAFFAGWALAQLWTVGLQPDLRESHLLAIFVSQAFTLTLCHSHPFTSGLPHWCTQQRRSTSAFSRSAAPTCSSTSSRSTTC